MCAMKIPMYQVDAFTRVPFKGNPAAVCVLESWPDDATLQNIAAENNLAETAFIIQADGAHDYDLRWFTPEVEMDLCGHATLASAYVVFEFLQPELNAVSFSTMSGELNVVQAVDGQLSMDFPARAPELAPAKVVGPVRDLFGDLAQEVWQARDLLVLMDAEAAVQNFQPDMAALSGFKDHFAVIITAPGDEVDFVSRFFAPNAGIPEDPVTGSAHCTLIPFWAKRLGRQVLRARQLSQRTGELLCENEGERVRMSGHATLFLRGEIYVS